MSSEFAFRISPQELLDTSLGQLRTLTAFLHDQLPTSDRLTGAAARETRVCEEIKRSLEELIARSARVPHDKVS